MYELGGFPEDALKVLEEAIAELNLDENSGSEVFYYFIGRSNLFLKQDEKAQAAFEKALTLTNNRYTRAYIGLGSVYLRRAQCRRLSLIEPSGSQHNALCRRADGQYMAPCQLPAPECQALVQQELEQSLANYQQVLDEALESHLKNTARLSLGMAHRVQGEIALTEGANTEADRLLDSAIEEIQAILTPMEASRRYRYLGQAYLSLGAAYAQQAEIRKQRADKEGSLILYQQARDAFADCIAQQQQSPYDEILTEQIVAACKQFDEEVRTRQSSLQQGG
jgi:tetratricopeptide (TPR) repeat protein